MNLIWKLLRRHISVGQFVGFCLANLFGTLIVLLGFQLYKDVAPVLTADDTFMRSDYLIVEKRIGAGSTLSGQSNAFTQQDVDELRHQPFTKAMGVFTSSQYQINAHMGVGGTNVVNSELFFEAVPDSFVDAPKSDWRFEEGQQVVPIILPRSYIAMYNFGFAQSHALPKISDGLAGMIDIQLFLQGNGRSATMKGKVIGFSSRMNTILVPQAFMDWSNQRFAPDQKADPTRVIIQSNASATDRMLDYFDRHGYEVEDDKLETEKTTYVLRLMVGAVMGVGLVISLLSFFMLMLSIYLLVEKNSEKLENLLLIGYSPGRVARPYQWLTLGLNGVVLVIALIVIVIVRHYYLGVLTTLFPDLETGTMLPSVLLGLTLLVVVSLLNFVAIRRRIVTIWNHKE